MNDAWRDVTQRPPSNDDRVDVRAAIDALWEQAGAEVAGRLMPTGTCYCGCGEQTPIGAFFRPGHDKRAEAALLAVRYGTQVARLLAVHGYGPDRSVVDAAVQAGAWMACPTCGAYKGAPASIAAHQRRGCPGPVETAEQSAAIVDANLSRMGLTATPPPKPAPED